MARLNLTAKDKAQELILAYLVENASYVLADKINNGVHITKDNKELINKKDLDGFMNFANEEARKTVEKSARSACIQDNVVFGWAIHYFEEDSIEGTLFNLDGTEYKVVRPAKQNKQKPTENRTYSQVISKTKKNDSGIMQQNFFDLMNEQTEDDTTSNDIVDNSELEEIEEETELDNNVDNKEIEQVIDVQPEQKQGSPLYQKYMDIQKQYSNSVVAYRLGDFYEVFGENAARIAIELDLTLTGRDCGLEQRVPMIGFPYHAMDMYLKKIRQNHNVVVVDDSIEELPQIIVAGSQIIDKETGEILNEEVCENKQNSFAFNEYEQIMKDLFGEQLIIK